MAYNPPIGIPNPADYFGWEIDRVTPSWPASWTQSPSTSATPGYYYVDKTHGSATNSGNTYGHPDLPRASVPEGTLAAGSYIYVHAGVYSVTDSGGPRIDWYGEGTEENPIWITGNPNSRPEFADEIRIGEGGNTSYIIFENFQVSGSPGLSVTTTLTGTNTDHIVIRNVLREGTGTSSDAGAGIAVSTSIDGTLVSDVVIYDCVIRNVGSLVDTTDDHGVGGGDRTNRVWVLDNEIYSCGGDSVQIGHNSNYTNNQTQHWYIGRNLMYGNGENGIDIKCASYIIISQNHIYGPFTKEQGWGIVLHYGANSNLYSRYGWVIFNHVHHVSGGIYTGFSSGCDNINIVGNLVYDVHASYAATPDSINGYCVIVGGANGIHRVVDNTFYDYDGGTWFDDLSATDHAYVHGNIFANRNTAAGLYDFRATSGQESLITTDYNCYSPGANFFWNNTERDFVYMQGTANQELNSLSATPGLTNPTTNFFPTADSVLVGANVKGPVEDDVYDAFVTLFSGNIDVDYNGYGRSAGEWDIGALQYQKPRFNLLLNSV